jgi:hypothetical protein
MRNWRELIIINSLIPKISKMKKGKESKYFSIITFNSLNSPIKRCTLVEWIKKPKSNSAI